jgi:hypothetical protein
MPIDDPFKIQLHVSPINFLSRPLPSIKEDECIICLEPNNLLKNKRCSCIYHYHYRCINNIVKPNECIMCKKTYTLENNDEYSYTCRFISLFISLVILLIIIFAYNN